MRVEARFAVRAAVVAAVCCLSAGRAMAYVDLAPTLGRVVGDAKSIAVVEVQSFDSATQTVTLKPIKTLKGDTLTDVMTNRVAPPDGIAAPAIRRWAGTGSRGIWFSTKTTALVCIGTSWYQQKKAGDSWKLGVERPDLALAYCGTVPQLSDGIEAMLAGKSAVLTAVVYGATDVDTSFDLALGRNTLPGLARVQRINGNLNMASMVMAAASSGYVLGPGATNPSDLPKLRQSLKSPDAAVRAAAAESIGHLNGDAADAAADLKSLLADAAPAVRTAAASALLRVADSDAGAIDVLKKALADTQAGVKRDALNAVAQAGKPAVSLSSAVVKLMVDADESVRSAAIATFATLAPDAATSEAAEAVAVLTPMLDDVRWRMEAADALGRLGKHARPIAPALVAMLNDKQAPVQWAAVRAMSADRRPRRQAGRGVHEGKAAERTGSRAVQHDDLPVAARLGRQRRRDDDSFDAAQKPGAARRDALGDQRNAVAPVGEQQRPRFRRPRRPGWRWPRR
ncbi:MAG: HEAT repeat domain-containing protein [Tepidisphaeraceae bacterium]